MKTKMKPGRALMPGLPTGLLFVRFVLFALLYLLASQASAGSPRDVRILVDATALTNLIDKTELRKVLAGVAVNSVYGDGDYVGVWAFGETARPILPYGPLNTSRRRQYLDAMAPMLWQDRVRNLRSALEAVLFDAPVDARPRVILITGGANQTGRAIRNALLDQYVLDNLASVFREKKIDLQVLEIGNEGEVFFQKLLRRSGGSYFTLANKPDRVYSGVRYLAGLEGLTAEYSANNRFATIMAGSPVGVVISSVPPRLVRLEHPRGWLLNGSDTPPEIQWSSFSSNTLIRISPEALADLPSETVYWRVEGTGRKRALIVGAPVAYVASAEPARDALIPRLPKPDFEPALVAETGEGGESENFDFGGFEFSEETSGWFRGEAGVEGRYFPKKGYAGQDRWGVSIRLQPEIDYLTKSGNDLFEVTLFGRADSMDDERTHYDVRELLWTHVWEHGIETKIGIGKVFWGVTESQHLVDIVNQTDLVESIDGEEKLGQPMVKIGYETEWGNFDVFWLWYFRERTFPGPDGRLGSPIEIDDDGATYASSEEEAHQDVAVRFSGHLEALDFGVSWFSGTSREPLFLFNGNVARPALIPHYPTIDQAGLELQYIWGQWLLKFEGISRSGLGDRYTAATAGFEYTQVGFWGTDADLGWLVEYLWDDRGDRAPGAFEHDWFAGWRWTANDTHSSELLAGMIWDPESKVSFYSVEGSRRLGQAFKASVEARVFSGSSALPGDLPSLLNVLAAPDDKQKTSPLRYESHVQAEIAWFF